MKNNRLVWILVLVVICSMLTACAGQQKEVSNAVDANMTVDMSLVTNELNTIKFSPAATGMSDVDVWLKKAIQNVEAAQFVVSMMYRDDIGVDNIEEGKVVDRKVNMHREMNRWLGRSEEASFVLADLAHHPSLNYNGDEQLKGDEAELAEAVNWLETAANYGYGNSEFILGLMYYNGVVVERDKKRGRELILRAAAHGVSRAQYYIGMMYELGIDTEEDLTKSLAWLTYAAQNGSEDAKYILVMKYRDGIGVKQDLQKSESWRKGNEKHHAWSALLDYLGKFDQVCKINYDTVGISYAYEDGCGGELGAPWDDSLSDEENERIRDDYYLSERSEWSLDYSIDYGLAAKWMRRAVEDSSHYYSGILRAQTIFLSGCRSGMEFEDEYMQEQAAEDILNRVCAKETTDCQYYKATLFHSASYIDESNCSDDKCSRSYFAQKAFDLYQKAADGGNRDAMKTLGLIYRNMDEPSISGALDIHPDYTKAFDWLEKGTGDDEGKYMLANTAFAMGEYYVDGEVITDHPDLDEAVKWYQKALELGEQDASFELAKIYRNEKYSGRDDAKSIDYMRQHLTAIGKSDLSHFNIDYNQYNIEKTKEALNLANNLKNGTNGAKKDEKEALKWYKVGVESCNDMNDEKYNLSKNDLSKYNEGCVEIENLERIKGLSSAVEQSIRNDDKQHSDKLIEQFKELCVKDYEICYDKLKPMYNEAAKNAVRSVIALALSMNQDDKPVDDEIIKNTLYEAIIYQARRYENRQKFVKLSSYCDQLIGSSPISNDYSNRYAMYIIWYMSHLVSAAENMYYDKFKSNSGSGIIVDPISFDSFINKADEYIKTNKTAQNNYGYYFLRAVQFVE